jgi:hypothetical protein
VELEGGKASIQGCKARKRDGGADRGQSRKADVKISGPGAISEHRHADSRRGGVGGGGHRDGGVDQGGLEVVDLQVKVRRKHGPDDLREYN